MSQFRPAVALISVLTVCISFFVVAADDPVSEARSSGSSTGEGVIPAAISASGAYGTRWESDFRFFNPCFEELQVHIEFQPENTNNAGSALASRDLYLFRGNTEVFRNIFDLLPDLGGGKVSGSLRIQSINPSGCSVAVVSRTFNDTPGGTLGLTVPAMPVQITEEDFLDFPGLIHNDEFRSNLRLVNFSDNTLWVAVTAYDAAGVQVGAERSAKVFGRSTKQINGVAPWLGAPEDLSPFTVRVKVEGREIQAVATIVDNLTGDSVLYTSSSADTNKMWLAGAASLSGVNESQWRTDLWLYNPTGSPLVGESEFFVGDTPSESYVFGWPDLESLSTKSYLDVVSDELGLDETRGYIVLNGDGGGSVPQVAARTYSLDPVAGTSGLNLRPFSAEDLLYPGEVGYIAGVSNSPDLEAGFRTNLGMLNTAPNTWTTVRVTVLNLDGSTAAESYETNIPPGKMRQFNVFNKLGLGDIEMTGTVRFEVINGGAVAVYGTEIDNRTQDSIFIVAQRAEYADGCRYFLDPGSVSFDAAGGDGSFDVVTGPDCEWEVQSYQSWVSTETGDRVGSATIYYTVNPNSEATREGHIRAGRSWFRVNQDAAASELTVSLPGDIPMELVFIPPGTFQMGSPVNERGRRSWEDLHEVSLSKGYYIGKYEVTQAQWTALMDSNPAISAGVGDNYPVYYVTWNEIAGPDGFIERLNEHLESTGQSGAGAFRLPTEAEWEMAARGGTQTRFSFGDALECGDEACESCAIFDTNMWWCGNTEDHAEPVGGKTANAYGLYDVHGNLNEWVQDGWEEHLGTEPQTDPVAAGDDERKVTRGGSYFSQPRFNRSAIRHGGFPNSSGRTTGFRIARSLSPPVKVTFCGQTVMTDATLANDLECTSGEHGIRVGASNITLDLNGHTVSGHREGFGVTAWNVRGLTIENGTVENWLIGFDIGMSLDVTLQNLTIRDLESDDPDEFLTGVTGFRCQGFVVRDLVIEFVPVYHKEGVLLYSTDFTVDDIEFRGGAVGVNVSGSTGTVINSRFSGATIAGVLVAKTENTRVAENEFVGCEVGVDAYSLSETPGEVTGLRVEGNLIDPAFQGVHLWGTTDSAVLNNVIHNTWRGISLDKNLFCPDPPTENCYFATRNVISGNQVTGNTVDLYHHPNATGNTWENNTCETKEGAEIPACTGR